MTQIIVQEVPSAQEQQYASPLVSGLAIAGLAASPFVVCLAGVLFL